MFLNTLTWFDAILAQSVERKPFKLVAVGSIPTDGKVLIKFNIFLVSLGGYDTWFSPRRRGFESRTRN